MVVDFDGEFQSGGVHHSAAAGGGGVDLDRAFADDEFLVKVIFGDALLEIAFDDIGTKKLMAKTASAHMKKL